MKYVVIIAVFLLIYLIFNVIGMDHQNAPRNYVDMAHKIIGDVGRKLTKRYDMQVFGVTEAMLDAVNLVGLDFTICGPLSKDEIRKILVDSVEEFLSAINSDEEIRPFLKRFPFTANEIEIMLFIDDSKGETVYDPEIAVAVVSHENVWFATKDKAVKYGYKNKYEEDYGTTLKIVRGSK